MSFRVTVAITAMQPIDLTINQIEEVSEAYVQGLKPEIKFRALVGHALTRGLGGKSQALVIPVVLRVLRHTAWVRPDRLSYRFIGQIGNTKAVLDCECSPGGGAPTYNIFELKKNALEVL